MPTMTAPEMTTAAPRLVSVGWGKVSVHHPQGPILEGLPTGQEPGVVFEGLEQAASWKTLSWWVATSLQSLEEVGSAWTETQLTNVLGDATTIQLAVGTLGTTGRICATSSLAEASLGTGRMISQAEQPSGTAATGTLTVSPPTPPTATSVFSSPSRVVLVKSGCLH